MLVKAVALSLVLGGVGFVANDALAAEIGHAVKAETGFGKWAEVLGYEDGKKINAEAEAAAKAACEAKATANEAKDAAAKNAEAIKTKADAWDTDKKFAYVQEMFDNQEIKNAELDNKNEEQDKAINANKDAIENEVKAREDADNKLDAAIKDEATARKDADDKLGVAIKDEATARKDADDKLGVAIKDEAKVRDEADKRIEAKFDGEVSRLDGRIDKLNDNVQKVGAMAAAIANLHTMGYDPEAPTEIAVGVGQYRDKTGLALGAFHYPNRDFMLSFSVSTAGDEFMGGIGATWKFGRKSPEELRQAEAEKAAKAKLAKAEAAKKAAKDARVAAQQKRHAEMLAARTGK